MRHQLSVVIPAVYYDEALKECLRGLVKQENVQVDCWVVFNPTVPSHFKRTGWPSWIRFLTSPSGVNTARNKGLSRAQSDFVFFLDSDCVLTRADHLSRLADFLLSKPNAAGVGGFYELPEKANVWTQAYHRIQMAWLLRQMINGEGRARALIGGHMMLRRSKIPSLKFNEAIRFGGSEQELFLRLKKSNTEIYLLKEYSVLHVSELSRQSLIDKAAAQGRGFRYLSSIGLREENVGTACVERPDAVHHFHDEVELYKKHFAHVSVGGSFTWNNPLQKIIFKLLQHLNVSRGKVVSYQMRTSK